MEVIRDLKQVAARLGSWLNFVLVVSPWASHLITQNSIPSSVRWGEKQPLSALIRWLGGRAAQGCAEFAYGPTLR